MKKLFYALMMCCALLLLACGGKNTQGESGDTDSDSITSERQQYRFEHQFIKADDKNYDSIVVKGYKEGKVAAMPTRGRTIPTSGLTTTSLNLSRPVKEHSLVTIDSLKQEKSAFCLLTVNDYFLNVWIL